MPIKQKPTKASPPTDKTPSPITSEIPSESFDPQLLADDDDWLPEPIAELLCGPNGESIAQGQCELLARLLRGVEAGEIDRVAMTLRDGIRTYYRYTKTHKLSVEYYLLHLGRDLEVEDEPEQLLGSAIVRAESAPSRSLTGFNIANKKRPARHD